jgi:hypothetical protein
MERTSRGPTKKVTARGHPLRSKYYKYYRIIFTVKRMDEAEGLWENYPLELDGAWNSHIVRALGSKASCFV